MSDAALIRRLIPRVYPDGLPAYWMYEPSGLLGAAVQAFLAQHDTPEQRALVVAYCRYWCQAPCWSEEEMPGLTELRQRLTHVVTHEGLSAWLAAALAIGMDPL